MGNSAILSYQSNYKLSTMLRLLSSLLLLLVLVQAQRPDGQPFIRADGSRCVGLASGGLKCFAKRMAGDPDLRASDKIYNFNDQNIRVARRATNADGDVNYEMVF